MGCTGLRFVDTPGLIVQWSSTRKKEKFCTQETATRRLKILNEVAKKVPHNAEELDGFCF